MPKTFLQRIFCVLGAWWADGQTPPNRFPDHHQLTIKELRSFIGWQVLIDVEDKPRELATLKEVVDLGGSRVKLVFKGQRCHTDGGIRLWWSCCQEIPRSEKTLNLDRLRTALHTKRSLYVYYDHSFLHLVFYHPAYPYIRCGESGCSQNGCRADS